MNRLEAKLKQKKLRVTGARKVIFDILSESHKALSAQDVCEKMNRSSQMKADQASVYRNLNLFSEIGLVHQVQSGKYALCLHGDHQQHNHMHIVASCNSCGKTLEIEDHPKGLCETSKKFKKYFEDFGSFSGITFQGQCLSCSK